MIRNLLDDQWLEPTRTREAGGWTLPVTTAHEVGFALKLAGRGRRTPYRVLLEALTAVGREGRWLSEADELCLIERTGTTRKFLRESIGRVNRWLSELDRYVASQGEMRGDTLRRGRTALLGGLPTAVILAGDASSVAPIALTHLLLANANAVVKASSVEPLSPYLFLRALLDKGLSVPTLLCFDTTAEEDRGLIRQVIAKSAQAVIYGEDRTVDAVYQGQPFRAQHKVIAYWSGRSAAVVLPDADLEAAATAIVHGAAEDRGNRCSSTKKLFAPRALRDQLEPLLVQAADALVRGDPADPRTDIGRLDPAARAAVDAATQEAEPLYERELVMVRAPATLGLLREELPYPVLAIRYVDDDEDLVKVANATVRGTPSGRALSTAVFTRSEERFEELALQLDTYRAVWNRPTTHVDLMEPHQSMHLFVELMRPRLVLG